RDERVAGPAPGRVEVMFLRVAEAGHVVQAGAANDAETGSRAHVGRSLDWCSGVIVPQGGFWPEEKVGDADFADGPDEGWVMPGGPGLARRAWHFPTTSLSDLWAGMLTTVPMTRVPVFVMWSTA